MSHDNVALLFHAQHRYFLSQQPNLNYAMQHKKNQRYLEW